MGGAHGLPDLQKANRIVRGVAVVFLELLETKKIRGSEKRRTGAMILRKGYDTTNPSTPKGMVVARQVGAVKGAEVLSVLSTAAEEL